MASSTRTQVPRAAKARAKPSCHRGSQTAEGEAKPPLRALRLAALGSQRFKLPVSGVDGPLVDLCVLLVGPLIRFCVLFLSRHAEDTLNTR